MKKRAAKLISIAAVGLCATFFFLGFIEKEKPNIEPKANDEIMAKNEDDTHLIQEVLELNSENRFEKAIDVLVKSINEEPDQKEIFKSLLASTFDIFLEDKSITEDSNTNAYIKIANSLEAIGSEEEAKEILLQAIKKDPDNPLLWAKIADMYYKEKLYFPARDIYEEVLKLDPTNENAIEKIARVNLKNKFASKEELKKSINKISTVKLTSGKKAPFLLLQAKLYYRLGDLAETQKALEKAHELDPGNSDFKRQLDQFLTKN